MLRRMMKSKIHRMTVTDANLNYVGSITLDPELLARADIRLQSLCDPRAFLWAMVRRLWNARDDLRVVGAAAVMEIQTIAVWNAAGEVRRIDLHRGLQRD